MELDRFLWDLHHLLRLASLLQGPRTSPRSRWPFPGPRVSSPPQFLPTCTLRTGEGGIHWAQLSLVVSFPARLDGGSRCPFLPGD